MKKLLLLIVGVFLIGSSAMAQEVGKKAFKKANRLLGTYNLDPGANADKLSQAKILIESALADEEVAAMSKAWVLKGKILNELVGGELNKKIIDDSYELTTADYGIEAYEALSNALEMSVKGFEKKDAISGLQINAGHIANIAIIAFSAKEYDRAFDNFAKTLEIDELMVTSGEPSSFDEATMKDQVFYTAVSGYYAEKYEEAEPIFVKAIEIGDPDPFVYEGLYNMLKETDKEKAIGYLEAGRERYPDDTALLYAEINYMVAEGLLEELIGKLENAVEKDPENISVYTTLGAVYDNLATKSAGNDEPEKAADYFNNAMSWFEKALAKDEDNFDALYSLGALYYNKAATYTEPLNTLANDFSADGNKKYDALKAEMDELFDVAFPYFQRAEKLNPLDMNTLLAIKEIYARKNDLDKATEYKEKIDALGNK